MASIFDTAAYILRAAGRMPTVKLHKLCYYAYGYHMAWESRQLFPERFQAWENGPAAPDLNQPDPDKHFMIEPGDVLGDPEALDAGERESVDVVLADLGGFGTQELSEMTHREPPFYLAQERAGVVIMQRSSEELRDSEIAAYFATLLEDPSAEVEVPAEAEAAR
jgi:uncharacterized phage-associated protein